jgi:hypothetical protein
LIDRRITPFEDNNFYLEGRPIPIDAAYNIGGIHIVMTDTFSGDLSQPDPPLQKRKFRSIVGVAVYGFSVIDRLSDA